MMIERRKIKKFKNRLNNGDIVFEDVRITLYVFWSGSPKNKK